MNIFFVLLPGDFLFVGNNKFFLLWLRPERAAELIGVACVFGCYWFKLKIIMCAHHQAFRAYGRFVIDVVGFVFHRLIVSLIY